MVAASGPRGSRAHRILLAQQGSGTMRAGGQTPMEVCVREGGDEVRVGVYFDAQEGVWMIVGKCVVLAVGTDMCHH